jgi:hypothetical protein
MTPICYREIRLFERFGVQLRSAVDKRELLFVRVGGIGREFSIPRRLRTRNAAHDRFESPESPRPREIGVASCDQSNGQRLEKSTSTVMTINSQPTIETFHHIRTT